MVFARGGRTRQIKSLAHSDIQPSDSLTKAIPVQHHTLAGLIHVRTTEGIDPDSPHTWYPQRCRHTILWHADTTCKHDKIISTTKKVIRCYLSWYASCVIMENEHECIFNTRLKWINNKYTHDMRSWCYVAHTYQSDHMIVWRYHLCSWCDCISLMFHTHYATIKHEHNDQPY